MFYERNGYQAFSLGGIEVSFSISYFIVIMGLVPLYYAFNGQLLTGLFAALAITVSVLIHEFGHAVVCKAYKLEPSILLQGLGGLCFHRPASTDWRDILIVLAGPVIQILVGLAAFFALGFISNTYLNQFVYIFAWVSVVWGGLNLLLPIYPLDGGRLFMLILRRFIDESKAQDITLKVSMVIAVPGLLYAIFKGHFIIAFLAFSIVMENYKTLTSGGRLIERKAKIRASEGALKIMAEVRAAVADEDWREAARLCHIIRYDFNTVTKKMMDEIWLILGTAAVKEGDYEEAIGWLERAPDSAKVAALLEEARSHLE